MIPDLTRSRASDSRFQVPLQNTIQSLNLNIYLTYCFIELFPLPKFGREGWDEGTSTNPTLTPSCFSRKSKPGALHGRSMLLN
jgi:hypothetical protein